ncbi:hypothetical protein BMW23_0653 [Bodo saltans virus]|uniref:Uncharacterized protein n=1 Tax=Bodo saltans virus TaxID=2024608 RepID=A0A2H4UV12_9VIRU|nr:hypothetical protein QJ851_gp0636 [Bodo saltans virus]ATZ80699.1 hypothetical protein BMW23_0653 [Bodo saltans virus]
MNYQDIIIITIIAILIAIAIIINVRKMLNDKLSHVEIKVPEIEIPQSNIVVKVQRECGSDNFDVHIEKEQIKSNPQVAKLANNNYTREENIEGFETTPESPHIYEESKSESEQKHNKSKNIAFTCIPTEDVFSGNYDPRNVKKYNIDIVNKIIENDKKYENDMENYKSIQYLINMNRYVSVSYDNDIVKGGNIVDYEGSAGANDLGIININNNEKYPKPNHYTFSSCK